MPNNGIECRMNILLQFVNKLIKSFLWKREGFLLILLCKKGLAQLLYNSVTFYQMEHFPVQMLKQNKMSKKLM